MSLDAPLLVPGIRLDKDAAAETRLALARARQPWVAGFLLFGGEAAQVTRLTADLRDAAGRPLFIASDMERGAGQQVRGLTRLPDLGLLGLAGTWSDAFAFGQITAREALSVGVDVIFGPCLDVRSEIDNPILGSRAFGFDPGRVADLGAAYVAGVLAGGGLPVAKHFPGHGATREDSHDAVPVVEDTRTTLEARDLPPFHKAVWWSGCPAVMTAHVAYPALDPSGCIATFSKPIVDGARALVNPHQEDAGLLIVTDALLMAGAVVAGGESEAAQRSLAAGCDVLLYPAQPEGVAAALAAEEADVERALGNIERFLALGSRLVPRLGDEDLVPDASTRPAQVALRAVDLAWDMPFGDRAEALVLIDDDDIEERGEVLARIAAAQEVPVARVRIPRGEVLALPAFEAQHGVLPEVAIVVFASARAWKGAAGVSGPCRAAVEAAKRAVLDAGGLPRTTWCTPRPEDFRDVHLPGTGRHLEQAMARRLFPADEDLAGTPDDGVPTDT